MKKRDDFETKSWISVKSFLFKGEEEPDSISILSKFVNISTNSTVTYMTFYLAMLTNYIIVG